jgi:hypothetical protein
MIAGAYSCHEGFIASRLSTARSQPINNLIQYYQVIALLQSLFIRIIIFFVFFVKINLTYISNIYTILLYR